ncbi:hypothetical protein Tco_1294435 [Tanacetum coccineum]
MYTFSPMMVANSRKHHCRVRSYTREVLVISTNLDIQKNHYPLDFRNRRGDEARIKNTWYNQGLVNECTNTTQIKSSKALPKLKMSSEFSWSSISKTQQQNVRANRNDFFETKRKKSFRQIASLSQNAAKKISSNILESYEMMLKPHSNDAMDSSKPESTNL